MVVAGQVFGPGRPLPLSEDGLGRPPPCGIRNVPLAGAQALKNKKLIYFMKFSSGCVQYEDDHDQDGDHADRGGHVDDVGSHDDAMVAMMIMVMGVPGVAVPIYFFK